MDLVRKVWDQCFRSFLGDEYIDSYVESERFNGYFSLSERISSRVQILFETLYQS